MREIIMKPDLYKFETFKEFTEEFVLGKGDLILTTRPVYDNVIKQTLEGTDAAQALCVIQEDYGKGEPTEDMIGKIFDAVSYDSYDRVIAIGGGTIMDIGKLLVLKRPSTINDLFFKREPILREKKLIAIPTTCGTGSEVTKTSVAIVNDGMGGTTKLGLLDEDLIADTAVLIPEFIKSLPHQPFAESLIDALIHAVESYLSPDKATMTSDLFGEGAIKAILRALKAMQDGCDIKNEYAGELLTAACYAGIAFLQAGCGIIHGVSYPMSGKYFVTHGAANYVFFESAMRMYNETDPEGKIAQLRKMICEAFGTAGADADAKAFDTLFDAVTQLLPPKKMHEYGVKEEDIDLFTESVFANQMRLVDNAYIKMTPEQVRRLYVESY